MKISKKKCLFLFLAVISLAPGFVFALETIYPPIPGLPAITDNSELGDYVAYFFSLAVMASGILAVIVLTLGAVRLIMSGGNPAGRKEAVDMIKGSVLGMVLLVSSFMLLRTINISLVTPSLTPLPAGEGIFYTNGTDRKPAPMAEQNTSNRPEGYDKILYDCSSGPTLFIWKFAQHNFESIDSAFVETVTCGDSTDIAGIGSFKMAFKSPGVYYFLGSSCTGYMSGANTGGGQLAEPFKDKVKSIKIMNNIANNVRYGVIFHGADNPSEVGPCSNPYFTIDPTQEESCFSLIPSGADSETKTPTSSATFFVWNGGTPETSGTGVDFYSEPWGKFLGARAGKASLSKDTIKTFWYGTAQNLTFTNYTGSRLPQYRTMYPNFYQKPGSIALNGNYLVAFYSNYQNCKIFFNDAPNLKQSDFFATGNRVDFIDVIPIK